MLVFNGKQIGVYIGWFVEDSNWTGLLKYSVEKNLNSLGEKAININVFETEDISRLNIYTCE